MRSFRAVLPKRRWAVGLAFSGAAISVFRPGELLGWLYKKRAADSVSLSAFVSVFGVMSA